MIVAYGWTLSWYRLLQFLYNHSYLKSLGFLTGDTQHRTKWAAQPVLKNKDTVVPTPVTNLVIHTPRKYVHHICDAKIPDFIYIPGKA